MKERTAIIKTGPAPLLIALVATAAVVGFILSRAQAVTGGVFPYPVDDAYIHMQIARNLADHGNWGINGTVFGSASSSLLYTLVLAALFKVFSAQVMIPFFVNCAAAIALLFVVWRWLGKQGMGMIGQVVVLLLVVFFTPLPVLVVSGMEHTLQCLFTFLFLTRFASWLQEDPLSGGRKSLPVAVIVFAALTVAIRYEGLFLVSPACLLLFYHRRWKEGLVLGFFAALPVFIFGIFSLAKGSYFFPNSLLIKSEAAQFSLGGAARAMGNILIEKLTFSKAGVTLLATQRLLLVLPLAYIFFFRQLKGVPAYRYLLLLLTAGTFFQLALADTGKFYRYEAYLISTATAVLGVICIRFAKEAVGQLAPLPRLLALALAGALLFPLLLRSMAGFTKARQACINIYEQQYQMAQFSKKYYGREIIAANDIGALAYFNKGQVLDVWGLADIDIARSKKGGYWTGPFIDSISRQKGARVAMVYDTWLGKSLPGQWKKVGIWQIRNNVVCGDDSVSFYAVDPGYAEGLKANMEAYRPSLPPGVIIKYY